MSSTERPTTTTPSMKPLHIDNGGRSDTQNNRSEPLLDNKNNNNNNTYNNAFQRWLYESAWPGMGLFGESYLLFSIGTLKPIWDMLYPDCFVTEQICSPTILHSLTYSVVLGIITGMIGLGILANSIGRRRGSITTATLMAIGAVGLTCTSVVFQNNAPVLFASMSCFLFVFGVGVGGEYPLSASSASERAMGVMKQKMALELQREEEQLSEGILLSPHHHNPHHGGVSSTNVVLPQPSVLPEQQQQDDNDDDDDTQKKFDNKGRGKRILLVFTMQGMGIFVNCIVLTLLLFVTGQFGNNGAVQDNGNDGDVQVDGYYNATVLLAIWRITYGIGAAILIGVMIGRIRYLPESQVWQDDKLRRERLAQACTTTSSVDDDVATTRHHSNTTMTAAALHHVDDDDDKHNHHDEVAPAVAHSFSDLTGFSEFPFPPWTADCELLKQVPSTTAEEDLKASPVRLLFRNYGWRLIGSSLAWFLWDIAFYGNKLFQSSFILALTGEDTTLLEVTAAAALNAFVALLGYFAAAFVVDNPRVGRLRLQQWGFLITGTLFVLCGFLYDQLPSTWLVVMYFGSSFFGQCGPNATTFLIPAEIFPTEMRTMCHGIAAASGKAGALLAAIMFHYVQEGGDMFLMSGYASFGACIITFLTIPETTTLDLYDIDRKWRMTLAGRKGDYEGAANNPEYLSFYERQKLGWNY